MTMEAKIVMRLKFLIRVVRKECQHLTTTHFYWQSLGIF
jgi:hypothetical protein